ncbi:MAG: phenylalanine--tRNA ligase subunit alpha [Candidatus Tagabacteria bacterium RIFCSPLOWO2_01_FULL_39_11]|uniref:Phenylalanine--tRNA ligase alpha subunit n=1 Tax=Candidatus Tagabacteria bacterium RIFCSPLOWO2_01_FULL_39_11 TaxID=1802295 RepID=A0A1G2LS00_9BACT|nr:MAG: phenylalanine--tRNA ligase subunit alpha [Candidatus Tagabacteria bacterium RIFCSPLOWO2_01_FULL_39_11]
MDIQKLKREFLEKFKKVVDFGGLKKLEAEFIGKKGVIRDLLQNLKELSDEKRKSAGKAINDFKIELTGLIEESRKNLSLSKPQKDPKEWIDVSAPGSKFRKGHIHPLSKIISEIIEIFGGIGFSVATGPEIETEWYNFDALNIPGDHPAREMWDTFWLLRGQKVSHQLLTTHYQPSKSQRLLLRTHTSPVWIRYMQSNNPPLRIIAPGNTFRYEATDASHDFQFYQFDGLMVGEDISIANFKAVIKTFFEKFFKKDVEIRLRPSYFPFVEPGFEIDIRKEKSDWLEVAGAGIIHPNVFKAVGYNPKDWQGFAFGFGIDRLAMLKYKISDIRLFRSGDLRFLKQF